MPDKNSRVNIKSNILAYIYLLIVSIHMGLVYTELEPFDNVVRIITLVEFVLFVAYIINCKYKIKTLSAMTFLIILAMVTYVFSGSAQLVIMVMTGIVFISLDYKRTFKYIFEIRLTILLIIVLFSKVGVLDPFRTEISKSSGIHIGYGLGYTHPNRLACSIQALILLFVCYKKERLLLYHKIGIVFIMLGGFYITKSRTLVFSIIGLLVLYEICNSKMFKKKIRKIFNFIAISSMPVLAFFSILIPNIIFKSTGRLGDILRGLNGMLSLRITYIYRAFQYCPVTLFGGTTDFSILEDMFGTSVIDSGYVRILYRFGIIGFIIFIAINVISVKRMIRRREYIYVCIFMVISFWGAIENILGSFAFNIAIAFWAEIMRNQKMLSPYPWLAKNGDVVSS